jgi:hypothetical protein
MATSYQEQTSGTLPEWNTRVMDLLNKGKTQAAVAYQPYTGQLTAGLTPQQQAAFQQASSSVGNWQPELTKAGQLIGQSSTNPLWGQAQNAAQGAANMDLAGIGSGLYEQAQQGIRGAMGSDLANVGNPMYSQATNMFTGAGQYDPNQLQQYLNPYLSGVVGEIGRLGNEQFQNQVLPGLTGAFSGLGQHGSARQAMMMSDAAARNQREILGQQATALNTGYTNAMGDYLNWAKQGQASAQGLAGLGGQMYNQALGQADLGMRGSQALAGLGSQQYTQGLGQANLGLEAGQMFGNLANQQSGAQLAAGTGLGNLAQAQQQLSIGDYGQLLNAGTIQQQQQQKELDAQYEQWGKKQQYPWEQLGNYAKLFGAGTPQQSNNWSASFKKGGLARYADGGRFPREEPDDLISDLISSNLSSSSSLPELAQQAGQMRLNMAQELPAQALQERSMIDRLGSALFQASAQGPAHWGQLIGRAGSAFYGEEEARQAENRKLEQEKRAMQERLTSLSGLGGGRVLQGRQPTPEQVRTVYTSARNEAAQIAKDYQFPTAEARSTWIEQQAMGTVENYLQNFAIRPIGPRGESPPINGTPPLRNARAESVVPPQRAQAGREEWPAAYNEPRVKFDSSTPGLSSLDMRGTPESVRAELQSLSEPDRTEALRSLEASQAPGTPIVAPQAPSPPPRDKRAEQYKQAYGGEEGKALFKERENLNTLFGTNASMVNQLNLLENLYSNPNLPEGELGPLLQKIRSGFQTFGVDVGDTTGPADLANAVAQKMVLAQRTSDGTNLLPGAVSNFEVQLLQSMGPTLSLTNEGRQALVRFMKEVALSNQRIADEGSAFAAQNNEMLTPGWYKRKERVMLEEMAKMKRLSDRVMLQFGNQERGAQ